MEYLWVRLHDVEEGTFSVLKEGGRSPRLNTTEQFDYDGKTYAAILGHVE